jgi:hypothetical protein
MATVASVSCDKVVGALIEIMLLAMFSGATGVRLAPEVNAADPRLRFTMLLLASRKRAATSVDPVLGAEVKARVPFTSTFTVDSLRAVSFPAPSSIILVVEVAVPLSILRSEPNASFTR